MVNSANNSETFISVLCHSSIETLHQRSIAKAGLRLWIHLESRFVAGKCHYMSTIVGFVSELIRGFIVVSSAYKPDVMGNSNPPPLDQQRWCVRQLALRQTDKSVSWIILSSAERNSAKYCSGATGSSASSKMMLHRSL